MVGRHPAGFFAAGPVKGKPGPSPSRTRSLFFPIYTMGCNFLLGRVGFISFGQPAYLAARASVTAFYLFYFGHNPYIGILLGLLAGVVVSVIVGPFLPGCGVTILPW